jgi:hypothetical protein
MWSALLPFSHLRWENRPVNRDTGLVMSCYPVTDLLWVQIIQSYPSRLRFWRSPCPEIGQWIPLSHCDLPRLPGKKNLLGELSDLGPYTVLVHRNSTIEVIHELWPFLFFWSRETLVWVDLPTWLWSSHIPLWIYIFEGYSHQLWSSFLLTVTTRDTHIPYLSWNTLSGQPLWKTCHGDHWRPWPGRYWGKGK